MATVTKRYEVVDFDAVPGVACACGMSHRAMEEVSDYPATIHVTDISADARVHYHKRLTETYYILECGSDAKMELDGDLVPVKKGMCVLIRPGVRHRAIGRMRVLIVVLPKYDHTDEWFD
jgi:mannose-6-phosphate isomerase-like protein (cupin superfamily)